MGRKLLCAVRLQLVLRVCPRASACHHLRACGMKNRWVHACATGAPQADTAELACAAVLVDQRGAWRQGGAHAGGRQDGAEQVTTEAPQAARGMLTLPGLGQQLLAQMGEQVAVEFQRMRPEELATLRLQVRRVLSLTRSRSQGCWCAAAACCGFLHANPVPVTLHAGNLDAHRKV